MADQIQAINPEDVFLWPDGTWCYRQDAPEYHYCGDDYEIIPYGSQRWVTITEEAA